MKRDSGNPPRQASLRQRRDPATAHRRRQLFSRKGVSLYCPFFARKGVSFFCLSFEKRSLLLLFFFLCSTLPPSSSTLLREKETPFLIREKETPFLILISFFDPFFASQAHGRGGG
jgi:hypothetical protein